MQIILKVDGPKGLAQEVKPYRCDLIMTAIVS